MFRFLSGLRYRPITLTSIVVLIVIGMGLTWLISTTVRIRTTANRLRDL